MHVLRREEIILDDEYMSQCNVYTDKNSPVNVGIQTEYVIIYIFQSFV